MGSCLLSNRLHLAKRAQTQEMHNFQWSNEKWARAGSENGLTPNRWQASIWISHGLYWLIYVSLGLNDLPHWGMLTYMHWCCWSSLVQVMTCALIRSPPGPYLDQCWLVAKAEKRKKELGHTIHMYWNKFYFQPILITSAQKRKYCDLLQATMRWSLRTKDEGTALSLDGVSQRYQQLWSYKLQHTLDHRDRVQEVFYTLGKLQKSPFYISIWLAYCGD